MYRIQTLNNISDTGLGLLPEDMYQIAADEKEPDGILVRSFKMHDMELPESLKAVARAGAGVNNIPVEACSEKGIVVFNTPGANANGVKELVLSGLFLSSRKIVPGIEWTKTLVEKGSEVPKLVEKGKSQFAGPEIAGKKLGVIGLGAIGVMVANAAKSLGMEVKGFDPYISIKSAWELSRSVNRANSLDDLIAESDYITVHVPLMDETKGMIDKNKFGLMKKGVRLLNFSRGALVNNEDLKEAIKQGIVACYVTDFPTEDLLNTENIITIPHLGASTPESEDNCAMMAAAQMKDFLENGNIKNSVNFPACEMNRSTNYRLVIAHKNIPNMVGQITTGLANANINIADMTNRSRKNWAYTMIDTENEVDQSIVERIKKVEGVVAVRTL